MEEFLYFKKIIILTLNFIVFIMASIAQLVSEMAHAVRQPNNKALRENLKLLIIQTRNEIIRRSYENHGYVDKLLTQRFRVSLTDVADGDVTVNQNNEIIDYHTENIYINESSGLQLTTETKTMVNDKIGVASRLSEYIYFQQPTSPDDWVLRSEGIRCYNKNLSIYLCNVTTDDEITINFTDTTIISSLYNATTKEDSSTYIVIKPINNNDVVITLDKNVIQYITHIDIKKKVIINEVVDIAKDVLPLIKRTTQKVPRPVRLTNNLPFDRVSSAGFTNNREFPYIKETSARFRSATPGLCGMPCYDYINEYIYIFPTNKAFTLNSIIIESAFEHPNEISLINGSVTEDNVWLDNNEYLLSEDMIGQLKEIIYKRDLIDTVRETDEIPNVIKY